MKKLLIIVFMVACLAGCGTVNVASRIGGGIGNSFRGSSERIVTAADAVKSWPAVSGLIKGVLSSNYDFEVSLVTKQIISELDALALKETLTDEEKGRVIGYFVRLEYIAAMEGWDRYGISVVDWLKAIIGG